MLSAETLASSTYYASDGAAYEYWLGRWARRLARPFLDFAAFPDEGDILDVTTLKNTAARRAYRHARRRFAVGRIGPARRI